MQTLSAEEEAQVFVHAGQNTLPTELYHQSLGSHFQHVARMLQTG